MNFISASGAIDPIGEKNRDRRFWVVGAPSPVVRVRASSPDPFHGLRGHDYIKARGLTPKIGPLRLLDDQNCPCLRCWQERKLAAVQAICAAVDRRRASPLQEVPWSLLTDDSVREILDSGPEV